MKRILLLFVILFSVASIGFSQDAATLINNANAALKAKNYAQAFTLYESAMSNMGDTKVDDAINYNIGFAAFNAKKYSAAVKYLNKAVAAKANLPQTYELLGKTYTKLSKTKEAIDSYKAAIDAGNTDKGSLYYNSGIAAYKGKMYKEASDLFGKAAGENYNPDKSTYLKALAVEKTGDLAAYKKVLEDGVKAYPNSSKLKKSLSNIYVSEGNKIYKKGVEVLSKANAKVKSGAMKTTDDSYKNALAESKTIFSSAIKVLKQAVAIDSKNKNALTLINACNQMLK